jgi:hypothetical protein
MRCLCRPTATVRATVVLPAATGRAAAVLLAGCCSGLGPRRLSGCGAAGRMPRKEQRLCRWPTATGPESGRTGSAAAEQLLQQSWTTVVSQADCHMTSNCCVAAECPARGRAWRRYWRQSVCQHCIIHTSMLKSLTSLASHRAPSLAAISKATAPCKHAATAKCKLDIGMI